MMTVRPMIIPIGDVPASATSTTRYECTSVKDMYMFLVSESNNRICLCKFYL